MWRWMRRGRRGGFAASAVRQTKGEAERESKHSQDCDRYNPHDLAPTVIIVAAALESCRDAILLCIHVYCISTQYTIR
jgi:hypothetical protein